jgi:hypothetical protein
MTTSARVVLALLFSATSASLLVLTAGCVGVAPSPEATQPPAVATQAAARPPVVPAPTTPTPPLTLDLSALEAQLGATTAIGVLTKISLKNQVDDLKQKFREHHEGKRTRTMTDLRRSYTLLVMKMLSLLQDTDQMLAAVIVSSREAIWGVLSDQNKFANL